MPSIPIATHFLTGSILTLVLPVAVLIVILLWWAFLYRRRLER
jgi:hypothetical protein